MTDETLSCRGGDSTGASSINATILTDGTINILAGNDGSFVIDYNDIIGWLQAIEVAPVICFRINPKVISVIVVAVILPAPVISPPM